MDDKVFGLPDPGATSNPFVNMDVSLSGKNSGVTSGSVTGIDVDFCYNLDGVGGCETFVNNANEASYSSQSGDSGGTIMSGNSLVGVHVASGGTFIDTSEITSAFSGLTWGF